MFGKKSKTPKEYLEIKEYIDFAGNLLESDKYIARSDYKNKLEASRKVIDFFEVLKTSEMLSNYCKTNGIKEKEILGALDEYHSFTEIVEKHNDKYIENHLKEEKNYLDTILKDVDENILLDNNQREVILTDEDYCLVIAGAGAGKTTTVAAKAKYLIEKKHIDPKEILIISFTNKAVEELREKINNDLKLNCKIATFHSIGNAILRTQGDDNANIVMESKLYYLLQDYFRDHVFSNEQLIRKLVLFFSTYFDAPYEGDDLSVYLNDLSKANYSTLKGDINDFKKEIIDARSKKKVTIQNEIVRSEQEVAIANFLYLNNLDYEYEPLYEYKIELSHKPYTPDFVIRQGEKTIYLEHLALSQKGESTLLSDRDIRKYKKSIKDKKKLHDDHGTKLIFTFSKYDDGRPLIEHLEKQLIDCGLKLDKKDEKEILKKIVETEENKYVSKLIVLICKFINLFKTDGFTVDKFDEFKNSTSNVRSQIFMDIAKDCYLVYEKYLKENNSIDFQDMINNSSKLLHQMANKDQKLHYKYVIVDEYQDISAQRFDLVEELHKVCDAKIIAVGDDWQSIYAFSGSDIKLFLDFEKKMGYAKLLIIENTYRNAQEVIDIAGNFIQKNQYQIKKTLKSPKHIEDPIIIYTYDPSSKSDSGFNKEGANFNLASAVERCLDDIVAYNKKEGKDNNRVLLLGRYGFDINHLEKSGLFQTQYYKKGLIKSKKHPKLNITFMTAHASKGLGYDNVIIINCINGKFGFPSKIQTDPVMKHVQVTDNTYDYAEERRLFYVAITRTKNRVFCVAPNKYPSEFLIEINRDYENISKRGEWVEEVVSNGYQKKCPICGYPMQFKYKAAYGLKLHICTNEPEICGFMTNEIKAGKLQIIKCDKCKDGYLVVKKNNKTTNGYFLGCTNYKDDGKGCNNVVSIDKYYEMMKFNPEPIVQPTPTTRTRKTIHTKEVKSLDPIQTYEKNKDNMFKVITIIINCIISVSKYTYLGQTKIIDILYGEKTTNKKININYVKEFGMLKNLDRTEIENLFFTMLKYKLIYKTAEQYPVIHVSIEGNEFINKADDKQISKIYNAYKNISKAIKNKKS